MDGVDIMTITARTGHKILHAHTYPWRKYTLREPSSCS